MRPIMRQAEQYSDRVATVRKAIPEHLDRRWKEKLMDHLVQQYERGEPMGFTLHDQLGDGPTSGVSVAPPPDPNSPLNPTNKGIPLSDLTAGDLGQLAEHYRDRINSDRRNNLGGWVDDDPDGDPYGRFFGEMSHNHADSWEGAGAALAGNQIGVYDYDEKPGGVYRDTPSYFHDQIAKGGRRVEGQWE